MTIGIVLVAPFAASDACVTFATMRSTFELHQLRRGKPVELPFREPVLDDDVLSFDIAELAQRLPEWFIALAGHGRTWRQVAYSRNFLRLLGYRGDRPRRRCTAEQANEFAPLHRGA
ncbi:MAG: hypothetical protein WBM12_09245 [Pseudolabrys sp.]